MTTLVERLREEGLGFGIGPAALCQEAAMVIERQAKAIDEAREALEPFALVCFDGTTWEGALRRSLTFGDFERAIIALTTLTNGGDDGTLGARVMRYEPVLTRIGENVGPVDWDHPIAKGLPPIWREAELQPELFVFSEYKRAILKICMYDGWPYWRPTPAICFVGPLNSPEWSFFNSYGVNADSIQHRERGQ